MISELPNLFLTKKLIESERKTTSLPNLPPKTFTYLSAAAAASSSSVVFLVTAAAAVTDVFVFEDGVQNTIAAFLWHKCHYVVIVNVLMILLNLWIYFKKRRYYDFK